MKRKPYKIQFADVAHYYVGQRFVYKIDTGEIFESAIESVHQGCEFFGYDGHDVFLWDERVVAFKLILKSPSKMIFDDKNIYYNLCKKFKDENSNTIVADTPESLNYAIKMGYDVFNLIEQGWAVDHDIYIHSDKKEII